MTGRSLPCEPRDPSRWNPAERLFFAGFLLLSGIFIAVIVAGMVQKSRAHDAFVAECLEDGKKRYECETMWGQAQGGGHTTPLPTK